MTSFDETCPVREHLDVYSARRRVRELGERAGFPHQAQLELEIVASELCTNILKYGLRGSLRARSGHDPERGPFIEVVAQDEGPPFHDLASAIRDGCDDRGPIDPNDVGRRSGLGAGLGAIVRFTHTFAVEPEAVGKKVIVRRYAREPLVASRAKADM